MFHVSLSNQTSVVSCDHVTGQLLLVKYFERTMTLKLGASMFVEWELRANLANNEASFEAVAQGLLCLPNSVLNSLTSLMAHPKLMYY